MKKAIVSVVGIVAVVCMTIVALLETGVLTYTAAMRPPTSYSVVVKLPPLKPYEHVDYSKLSDDSLAKLYVVYKDLSDNLEDEIDHIRNERAYRIGR